MNVQFRAKLNAKNSSPRITGDSYGDGTSTIGAAGDKIFPNGEEAALVDQ